MTDDQASYTLRTKISSHRSEWRDPVMRIEAYAQDLVDPAQRKLTIVLVNEATGESQTIDLYDDQCERFLAEMGDLAKAPFGGVAGEAA